MGYFSHENPHFRLVLVAISAFFSPPGHISRIILKIQKLTFSPDFDLEWGRTAESVAVPPVHGRAHTVCRAVTNCRATVSRPEQAPRLSSSLILPCRVGRRVATASNGENRGWVRPIDSQLIASAKPAIFRECDVEPCGAPDDAICGFLVQAWTTDAAAASCHHLVTAIAPQHD